MSVKQTRRFPQSDGSTYQPVPRTPRCQHNVQMNGDYSQSWRKNRYGDNWQKCTFPSVVEIDGKHYCRRHGGQIVLDKYIAGEIVDKPENG